MKRRKASPDTLKFLIVAILFMVLIDQFFYGGTRPYIEGGKQETPVEIKKLPEPEMAAPAPLMLVPLIERKEEMPPAWKEFAVPVSVPEDMPTVTIIIDDLGEDRAHTKEIIALPGPLTAAFLPYPAKVTEQVEEARKAGHEIMVHMPMEAEDADLNAGAYVLRSSMIPDSFEKVLKMNLAAFGGYVGINNHMGSHLTQDPVAMRIVMAHLYEQGLLFVDSRTIASSVAEDVAADYGVPHAARNVFLDNDPDVESVMKNLRTLEYLAIKKGHAIAIGHPKRATIDALKQWLPTLKGKKMMLVPASAVVSSPRSPGRTSSAEAGD